MNYIMVKTNGKRFIGKSKRIKINKMDVVAEYIRNHGIESKQFDKSSFRLDCTNETHRCNGVDEMVRKIQVQEGNGTYASVTLRASAIDRLEVDRENINAYIAEAIMQSYEKQETYEISYK